MSSPDKKIVQLPYQNYHSLQHTKAQSYDSVESFQNMLPFFLHLDRTRFPERRGGIIKLTHESHLSDIDYLESLLIIMNGYFLPLEGNYDQGENRLNTDYYRDMLLLDLVAMPGVDINGNVISMENGYTGYFARRTFTAPFILQS